MPVSKWMHPKFLGYRRCHQSKAGAFIPLAIKFCIENNHKSEIPNWSTSRRESARLKIMGCTWLLEVPKQSHEATMPISQFIVYQQFVIDHNLTATLLCHS